MPRGSKKALGQILPGLWIGRMAAVREIFHMQAGSKKEEQWTVVSMISSESMIRQISGSLEEEEQEFKKTHGRKLVRHHAVWDLPDKSDSPFVSKKLSEILQLISDSIETTTNTVTNPDRPIKNCLVHCARGVSRSAAVCAAWLISCKGYSLPDSMEMLQKVRDVNPNLGFIAGLRAIQKCDGDILKAEQRLIRKRNKNANGTIEGAEAAIKPTQKEAAPIEHDHKQTPMHPKQKQEATVEHVKTKTPPKE